MKAIQINKHGNSDVLEMVDIEKPKPGPGQVLIEVHASCVNPIDIKIMEGAIPVKFPFTLGSDVSGVVVEIDEGVENINVGDKVYGSAIVLAGATGAFAEFTAVPAALVAPIPKNTSFNEAAAAVLTGASALQALAEHMNLQAGQRLLIHGGAGGIGTMAIQIAKKLGAYVATTAAEDEVDYAKNLGTDYVINYNTQSFEDMISGYDAVLDTVGQETYKKSFQVLKKGGMIVSMIEKPNEDLMKQYGVTAISQFTKVTTEHLMMLSKYIERGDVRVYIDRVFPLDNIKEAFLAKEQGRVKGKIVIQIK
ncbi:MAG: hypothetical protein A3D44_02115 [Candidatus Staskawiczbacteria bacterium RIFCSPHIGHO2_02_FULL_42_22]|uniref:Enoyl reductase (ER) domain-containing protein n=1 Tax=Candidatus Staskawiczbacteria bacterium RIFCSPHIGHO2_02_FULL_42_22 TaxID=1802207 RepID=A0A1G2I271_9BACT|nr:MAG: hypothetical protein A3D44_02115 [Candidatus Staskawiczbacteria bacterium RIFCSPHIGHO2_02_FULL_42_22]